jgi:ATP-binding cassette, subfamily B, multidrug efflux pump
VTAAHSPESDAGPSLAARPPTRATAWKAVIRMLGLLRAYGLATIGATLMLLAVSAVNLITPQLIQTAIDACVGQRRTHVIVQVVAGLLLLGLMRGVFTFAEGYLAERAAHGVAYDLRELLFAHIQRLSFSFYDRVTTGQLLTRLTSDVEQVRVFVGSGLVQFMASGIMLVGCGLVLLLLDWRLAVAAVATMLPILILLAWFIPRSGMLYGSVQHLLGQLNTLLHEDLVGMRVIRAFGREEHERGRYANLNEALLNQNLRVVRVLANSFPLAFFFANLGTLVVIGVGGLEVLNGRLSVGGIVAFNTYLAMLLQPLLGLGFMVAGTTRAGISALRIFEVLDAPVELHDAPGAVDLPPIRGDIRFEDVTFRYPGTDQDVLRGVSFSVRPGQSVAIVGTVGAGKSTLLNLLLRFYDVTGGRVTVDGYDTRSISLASLRRQTGVVLQDARLFSGTVRDNIAYGKPEARDDEVEAAARIAQADEFIRALPAGYDTFIGERGVGLSGGQRQRLAIARALLIEPRLLILDDSTSSVDTRTEAAILAALDGMLHAGGHTTLVIAHRLSTLRDADQILVLDKGQLAASGTHTELLKTSELYTAILASQLEGRRPDSLEPPVEPASESARR